MGPFPLKLVFYDTNKMAEYCVCCINFKRNKIISIETSVDDYTEQQKENFKQKIYPDRYFIILNKSLFCMCKDDIVGKDVFLYDPVGNVHTAWVRMFLDIGFLSEGLSKLVHLYSLSIDHTFSFVYVGERQFHIHIRDKNGLEISYPIPNIPRSLPFVGWDVNASSSFVTGNYPLLIPAHVVQRIFLHRQNFLDLIFVAGGLCNYADILKKARRSSKERYLGKGWYDFCRRLEVRIGSVVKFCFYGDPYELFVYIERRLF